MTDDYRDKYIKLLEKHIKMMEETQHIFADLKSTQISAKQHKKVNDKQYVANSEVDGFAEKLFNWLQKRKKVLISSTEVTKRGYRRDKWLPAMQLLESQNKVTFIGKSVIDGKNCRQVWRVNLEWSDLQ